MGLFKLSTEDIMFKLIALENVFSLQVSDGNRFTLTEVAFSVPPIAMTCDLTSILSDTTMVTCDAI